MANRVGKTEVVEAIVKASGVSKKDAGAAFDAFVASVVAHAKKGSVSVPGLGSFSVVKTKARKGLNPATKAEIKIPAGKRLRFKASTSLKGKL